MLGQLWLGRLLLAVILLVHILTFDQVKTFELNSSNSVNFMSKIDVGNGHHKKQDMLKNGSQKSNPDDVINATNIPKLPEGDINNETIVTSIEDTTKNKKNPVKLTTKQGFILNQLIGTYALENIMDSLCRNHTKEFKTALRAFEPWALKMIDSSSKLQTGLLLGNLVEYGSYSQCLRIYTETEYGPLMGKHCLIKISPSDDLILKVLKLNNLEGKKKFAQKEMFQMGWSVCVPHSCPAEDIERHFNKTIMEVTVGVELEVSLNEHYCRTQMDYPKFGRLQYLALAFYGSFIVLGLLASVMTGKNSNFTEVFSPKKHISKILKIYSPGEYDFLYGLRFISSSFVVIGHRFIMFMIFPVINGIDELEWPAQYSSVVIIGSTVCVDSFFMVSGMLVSIGFFSHVTKSGTFNILEFYLYRYLRITLPMALVILFYVTLAQFLADGPYAYDAYIAHQKPCEEYWWSILLHLQTIINPGHLCLFPLWYLSCEMPFYYFSPVILYPLWKWPKLGYAIMIGSYLLFLSSAFYLAWINKYEGTPLPITSQLLYLDFFKKFYVAPHVRAPSYIIGLAFGYFLFVTKGRKIKISPKIRCLGWVAAVFLLILSAGGCHTFYLETHKYNRLEATSYLTFARPGWTFGMMWIIWSCMNGYGGILEEFLSAYIFKILGKLTYGFFLIHSIIQVYMGASSKVSTTFTNFNAVHSGLADIMMCIILGLFFTIFYEMPLNRIQTLLFRLKSNETPDDSLIEQFACPVCFEYMDKKIYICNNGHSLCGGCNSKLRRCPVCNVILNLQRNISLEQAAKKVKDWKFKQESREKALVSKGIGSLKQRTKFSSGSPPVRTKFEDFQTDTLIQCPHPKCCYFTKHLLEMKIHLERWHSNQLYIIKKDPGIQSEKAIRAKLYWNLNSAYNMFVLTAVDAFFIVYIVRKSNCTKNTSYIINVLTVSNKNKMFKFTCGNISMFSMFYQGRHQAQDGIEVDNNTIETQNRAGGYKNFIQIFITRVAVLHSEDVY